MPNVSTSTTITIPASASISTATAIGSINLVGISVPTLANAASIGLVVSVVTAAGTIITQTLRTPNTVFATSEFLSSGPAAGNFYWALDPNVMIGADFVQIRTGTEGSPVTQASAVIFTLHIRSFA